MRIVIIPGCCTALDTHTQAFNGRSSLMVPNCTTLSESTDVDDIVLSTRRLIIFVWLVFISNRGHLMTLRPHENEETNLHTHYNPSVQLACDVCGFRLFPCERLEALPKAFLYTTWNQTCSPLRVSPTFHLQFPKLAAPSTTINVSIYGC